MNTYHTMIRVFIPVRLTMGTEEYNQAHLTATICLITASLLASNVPIILFVVDNFPLALTYIVPTMLIFVAAVLMRLSGSVQLGGVLYIISLFGASLVWAIVSGGSQSASIPGMTVSTVATILLFGRNAGWLMLALQILVTTSFIVNDLQHIVTLPFIFDPQHAVLIRGAGVVIIAAAIVAFTQVFDFQRMKRQISLEIAQAATQQKVEEAVEQLRQEQESAQRKDALMLSISQELHEFIEENLKTLIEAMEQVSKGNLTVQMSLQTTRLRPSYQEYSSLREAYRWIETLAQSFNATIYQMGMLINRLNATAHYTTAEAERIAVMTEQVSMGAISQATQTAQIISAVEQIHATINNTAQQINIVAQNAEETDQMTQNIRHLSQSAYEAIQAIFTTVTQSAETIDSFSKNSEEIQVIASTINEIADQTNLLALNAAIEAARAGDHGRGFAVVADEVRKLAERTQIATKQIEQTVKAIHNRSMQAKANIERSKVQAQNGSESYVRIQNALFGIGDRVGRVSEVVTQIASASEEQAIAMGEIAASIESISATTQETAHAAQETLECLNGLQKLIGNLSEAAAEFHLHESQNSHPHYSAKLPRATNIFANTNNGHINKHKLIQS